MHATMERLVSIPAEFHDRDGLRATVHIVVNMALVLLPGIVAWHVGEWWAFAIAFLCVGVRGQACYILHHEAMHNLLYSSRRANELAGVLLSALLGSRYYLGRRIHMDHHRLVGDAGDPNELFHSTDGRAPGWPTVRHFLFHLLGGRLVMMLAMRGLIGSASKAATGQPVVLPPQQARIDLAALLGIQLVMLVAISAASSPIVYVFFYVLPLSTLTAFLEALRSFSEHVVPGAKDEGTAEARRRFFMAGAAIEVGLVAPFDFHYHHIHHLYPNVTTFKVRRLHGWLDENDPAFRGRFRTRPGYVRTALAYFNNRPFPGCGRGFPGIA